MDVPDEIKEIIRKVSLEWYEQSSHREVPFSFWKTKKDYFGEETESVQGTVLYPGAGLDISDLLAFPNASVHIHMDMFVPEHTGGILNSLVQQYLIDDASPVGEPSEERAEFLTTWKGISKKLIFYKGNVALFVPDEAKNGIDAIYYGLPQYSFEMMLINFLPLMTVGGLYIGHERDLMQVGLEIIPGPIEREVNLISKFLAEDPEDTFGTFLLTSRKDELLRTAEHITYYQKFKHIPKEELEQTLDMNQEKYQELLDAGKVYF